MAKITVCVCNVCKTQLYPWNWFHDEEVCIKCGIYAPIASDTVDRQPEPQSFPPSSPPSPLTPLAQTLLEKGFSIEELAGLDEEALKRLLTMSQVLG